jgi:hypothetical protein
VDVILDELRTFENVPIKTIDGELIFVIKSK